MKYVCLGYYDEKKWETMSEGEQKAFIDQCFDYDDELRSRGHALTIVDIDGDRELKRRYGWDVPVAVLDDGTVLASHTFGHTTAAFGSGFRIGLSQCMGAPGRPAPRPRA